MFRTHPDMRFVDKRMSGSFGARVLPVVGMLRTPHLGGEHFGIVVLHSAGSMWRDTFATASFPFHKQFVEHLVVEDIGGEAQFPVLVV